MAREKFRALLSGVVDGDAGTLLSLTFSQPDPRYTMPPAGLPPGVERVKVRPKSGAYFAEMFTEKQAFHRTLTGPDLAAFADLLAAAFFRNTVLCYQSAAGITHEARLTATRRGDVRLLESREKKRTPTRAAVAATSLPTQTSSVDGFASFGILDDAEPIPFLVHLGIQAPRGKIIASKQAKYRQIKHFLEIAADTLPPLSADEAPLRILDLGCGKAYLTFALYYFLSTRGQECEILGIDTKADVLAHNTALAQQLGYTGLTFRAQTIESFLAEAGHTTDPAPDLIVALHACDTATDYALAYGIRRKVRAILTAPCCQHEFNAALDPKTAPALLRPLLAHGLLRERFAALATDALRAQRLKEAGYKVAVLDFVDPEFTPKNTLIRAVLPLAAATLSLEPVELTCGITLTLDKLLSESL
ncbi:SAM-dependent methyltransferase [Fibrobacterales bacterium]|nr:SAM-dependent methyltransferase [Fibrobacterales bacterium]